MSFSIPRIKAPILLSFILLFSLFLGTYVPLEIKAFLYATSMGMKELLIFALPFFIFSFVLNTVIRLRNKALQFAILLIPLVCISNFFSTWLAYFFGRNFLAGTTGTLKTITAGEVLEPLWSVSLLPWITNDIALFSGFAFGILSLVFFVKAGEFVSSKLLLGSYFVLNRLFIPAMPVFILGFTLKLQHDQVLVDLCTNYFSVFLLISSAAFGYIFVVYAALTNFSPRLFLSSLRNMFPAFVTGFTTMSSAAAMPLTIDGSEKNTGDPKIAQSVIPATVNIHLVGDCFAIPILAMAVMHSFSIESPNFETYLTFSIYFVLAKFAVAAVPGGGILVMLPILEKYLHFSAPMLSWITTLYIIFDAVITSANVLGNGAFALFFAKIFRTFVRATTKLINRRLKHSEAGQSYHQS